MYNFDVFDQARRQYSIPDLPFLDAQRKKTFSEKPYQGLKVLHNIPLTLAAVFKIEALALGGAEVTTTCIKMLPPEERAIDLLKQANVKVQLEHDFDEEFDFHLDCCGELLDLTPPKIGAIELTQTGTQLYKIASLTYPMISVDDSRLKILETFFGTGDGFYRALYHLVGAEMLNKPVVLFGYGKVGQGILYALRKFTNNITVIDVETYPAPYPSDVNYINAQNKLLVKQAIANAWCTITATGVRNLISGYYGFKKEDFGACLLINMGADDEYGNDFEQDEVVFNKKTFNFSLDQPTALRYLDPVFYSHNLGIDLILSKKIPNGYNPFPELVTNAILEKWQSIYKENINHALIL
ncbi:MAG: hypothetical protein H0U73_01790 [Tatlockia sp.]|nr:hypothetical protein [Tatlockia sp.]